MAFKKIVQKILTGGINLLAPSDLLPPDGGECSKNWRVDTFGNLRSRDGMTVVMESLDEHVHTLVLVSGESAGSKRRYAGAGMRLFQASGENSATEAKRDAITGDFATFSGSQLGVVSYDGLLWAMDQLKQGRDDGSLYGTYWHADDGALGSFYPWLPKPPNAVPGVTQTTGTLGGAVKYYVTYDTAEGRESNPTTVGGLITPSGEITDAVASFGVVLSGIPVSPNPEVDKRHIYREGGMLPAPYRVWTINDNATTSWTDDGSVTDSMAVEDGYLMEEDHDPAPAAQVLAGPYNNRLIAGCSALHPNRMWWTPATKPWYFRGSTSDAEGDWLDVGELNEETVAFSLRPRMVIIYKEHSIWRLVGDLDDGILEQTNSDTGLIGRKAWYSEGGYDYFQGKEGVYRFDGDHAVKISERVDPIFKGWQSGSTDVNPVRPIDQEIRKFACMAIKHGRLYFSYPEAGAGT